MEETKTELQAYQEMMAKKRRLNAQALAILRRAKDADIPPSEMRIGEATLKSILCPNYHNGQEGIDELCHSIYHKADDLFNKQFIVIDGGDIIDRRKAGFALLFRMIACNYNGKFRSCSELTHQFQTINSTAELSRNDLADELKSYDVLFIDEFRRELIRTGFEIHWFLDEILSQRDLLRKPTIITFGNPLAGDDKSQINLLTSVSDFGNYLCMLSHSDVKQNDKIMRIRVRKS